MLRHRAIVQPLAHARVDDLFQLASGAVIGKHVAAHRGAVQPAVLVQHIWAKGLHHRPQSGRARFDHFAGSHVGVVHRHAQGLEPARHRALAGGNAAGHGDDERPRVHRRPVNCM